MSRVFCMVMGIALSACGAAETGVGTTLELRSLVVSPATASIVAGQLQQFSVSGAWSDGRDSVPSASFAATGGTISSAGLYTAGATTGSYRVIVTHIGGTLADTAFVTVTAPNPQAVVLVQEGFEDNAAAGRGWYDNVAWTTTTAEKIAGSTKSLEFRWDVGAALPTFGGTARHLFAPTRSLYVSYWVKYSANWSGSGVSYQPHEFQILTTDSDQWLGPSFTNLTTYIEHRYLVNGGVPVVGMTDGANIVIGQVGQNLTAVTETRSVAGCNGNSDGRATDCYALGGGLFNNGKWLMPPNNEAVFSPTAGPRYKNDWHRIEVFVRLNTVQSGVGQLDGVAQYWFDGQLILNEQNLLFRTGAKPTMQWNQFIIGPYIGPGSPVAQSMWIDDLLIATSKP